MTKAEKQEIVKNFLLTPIFRDYDNRIIFHNGFINSGQKYIGEFDADMSDIAIRFYKIIYGIDIINGEGKLIGKNEQRIAGDTMCSFNTVANLIPEAGVSKNSRTPYSCWPSLLKNYRIQYHCLANFWVLPIEEGRTLKGKYTAGRIDDYMDKYLLYIKDKYKSYFSKYTSYINNSLFENFDKFCTNHFLTGENNYINNNIINMYSNNSPDQIITCMMKLINSRAKLISEKFCDQLYELYSEIKNTKYEKQYKQ